MKRRVIPAGWLSRPGPDQESRPVPMLQGRTHPFIPIHWVYPNLMLAEEEEAPQDFLKSVLDIELVNGTCLYQAIRGDEMIFVEFSIGNSKVYSAKSSNTLHPVWNDSLKLQFSPEGKQVDMMIRILVDIEGKESEVATRKFKGLDKTLVESVPFNALDFKFGKEKRVTFSLTALNFGIHKELSAAKKLSIIAEEFSKYVVHLCVHLQNACNEAFPEEKLEKLHEDLDCENFLVKQKRISKEEYDQLESEIDVLKSVLKEAEYDPSEKFTREMARKIRTAIEGNSILNEMFKTFTERMRPKHDSKKKKKGKNKNYVRSFIKGVRKRGKRLSKFRKKESEKQGFRYKGNLNYIHLEDISITERRSDNESRGRWNGRDVILLHYPTSSGCNVQNVYIKLQLLAKLSQELPLPRIYGIVAPRVKNQPDPEVNRLSMNERKVHRLETDISILVDDEPTEHTVHSYITENFETLRYEDRMKLVIQIMEVLKQLHEDDFRHGYLSLKSLYFRLPSSTSSKKRKNKNNPINPEVHPLIFGRSYLSLVDQAIAKPIPREEVGFLAPEIIEKQFGEGRVPKYTEESDVFAFGMCAFLILGGKLQTVYHRQYGRHPMKTLDYTFPKSLEEAPMINKDAWLKEILMDCLVGDPTKRPSMRKIMSRFQKGSQESRGPAIFYCRTIDEDDADAEEMSVKNFTMRSLRLEIQKIYGEKLVISQIFEVSDDGSGSQRELKWNQDVYDVKDNGMIAVKFAPEGTKVVYADEEEESDVRKIAREGGGSPTNKKVKASKNEPMTKEQLSKKRVEAVFDGPKVVSQFANDDSGDDELVDDDEDDDEDVYSMSGEESDFEREPIVFYLRSSDEDDDDADDYLMNDFTISELKSTIFKERSGEFIKKIEVKKDDDSVHEIFTDKNLRDFMDEDDMVIVTFGKKGEEMMTFEKRHKLMMKRKRLPKAVPKRAAPALPTIQASHQVSTSSKGTHDEVRRDGKMILLQEENIKLKEELEKYKKKCAMLEKKVEEMTKKMENQNKEIGHMKLSMFKEF